MPKHDDFIAALRADYVRVLVENTGASETHVISIASQLIGAMQRRFGGERHYVKAREPVDAEAVVADFNYRNHDEVCRKHRITRRTLQRMLKARREKPATRLP